MTYQFANCVLDADRHVFSRAGVDRHLEPQVFDLLVLLARSAPALVSYDQMIEAIWDGRVVSDATLAARISAARQAVGDDGKQQAVIRTIQKRGVQIVVPVDQVGDRPVKAASKSADTPHQIIRYTKSADGSALAYAISGDGPPLLRAGHWLSHLEHDWSSPVWRPTLGRIGAGRKLVRYDPRGTGLSERTYQGGDLQDYVADLQAVADAASLDRFPILAASQSVPVAIAFAAANPTRVSRMVLVQGFSRGSLARGDTAKTETMIQMIRSGWGQAGSPFMKAFATLFMPSSTPEELDSFVEMQQVSASPKTAARLREKIGWFDVSDVLHKVQAPVLVLHSVGDAVQSLSEAQSLAAGLPNAEFRQIDSPNHVHVPSDSGWEVVMTETTGFLDRHE